ncbi:hypothetical protein SNEBB_009341, partial [Seison nebaliae]
MRHRATERTEDCTEDDYFFHSHYFEEECSLKISPEKSHNSSRNMKENKMNEIMDTVINNVVSGRIPNYNTLDNTLTNVPTYETNSDDSNNLTIGRLKSNKTIEINKTFDTYYVDRKTNSKKVDESEFKRKMTHNFYRAEDLKIIDVIKINPKDKKNKLIIDRNRTMTIFVVWWLLNAKDPMVQAVKDAIWNQIQDVDRGTGSKGITTAGTHQSSCGQFVEEDWEETWRS